MRVLVTGSSGFIGRNLLFRLTEEPRFEVLPVTRQTSDEDLKTAVGRADAVVHLAGVNRPKNETAFETDNTQFTQQFCNLLVKDGRALPVVAASSIQAERETPYGQSKRGAEKALEEYARTSNAPVSIYRLVNVFGKWCRPNYNSVVATFVYNITHDLPITIHDPSTEIRLVYVDDVIDTWIKNLFHVEPGLTWPTIKTEYRTTVGELSEIIRGFRDIRTTRQVGKVGVGLGRALYATYVSYLDPERFSYSLQGHSDERGLFAEMLRTEESGQFSFFSVRPGFTRGGHYHHTKTEKFLVLRGDARFRFREILTGQRHEIETSDKELVVVETIPGWAHDITNVGDEEMIVMLWANEVFDPERPDTIIAELSS